MKSRVALNMELAARDATMSISLQSTDVFIGATHVVHGSNELGVRHNLCRTTNSDALSDGARPGTILAPPSESLSIGEIGSPNNKTKGGF